MLYDFKYMQLLGNSEISIRLEVFFSHVVDTYIRLKVTLDVVFVS